MKIKELFGFCMAPDFSDPIYPTDPTVDQFIRQLIDHKAEVKLIKCDEYTTTIEFRGKQFVLWTSNYPSCYLSTIWLANGAGLGVLICDQLMPSKQTVFDFHEAFDAEIRAMLFESKNKLSVLRDVINRDGGAK